MSVSSFPPEPGEYSNMTPPVMPLVAPRWLQSASAMTRRSRRTDPRSWTFVGGGVLTITLLSFAALAYNNFSTASLPTPLVPQDMNMSSVPSLLHSGVVHGKGFDSNDSGIAPYKAMVVSSYLAQNVSWLSEIDELSEGWRVYRYIADDPETDYYSVAQPDGREALAYLTFIIDHYKELPEYIVFIHGHRYAWHQPESMVDKIAALNLTAVDDEEYVNMRCQMLHGCKDDDMYYFGEGSQHKGGNTKGHYTIDITAFWKEFMEEEFGPLPGKIGRRCCSQFAIPRRVILRRPLGFWKRLRSPLMRTRNWHHEHHHHLGLYFEMVWHILMGMPPVHCPSKDHCIKTYFSDLIHCTGNDEYFKAGMGTDGHGWLNVHCTDDLRNTTETAQAGDDARSIG